MKHLTRNALAALALVSGVLAGCEWGGGGDDNSWNDSNNIANFNGSYSANGGYLVSAYTVTDSSTGSATTVTTAGEANILNENKGSIPAVSFNGLCSLTPVKAGSFHLFITGGADGQLTDDGSGGLSGTVNIGGGVTVAATGTINYDNGAYGVNAPVSAVNIIGKNVTITYTQITGTGGTTTTTTGGGGAPGSSGGITIIAFNVQQTGNKLKIIDNNGSVYTGTMDTSRSTGNADANSQGTVMNNGDQVIAPFSASGKSASGMHVNMTGNFQGSIAGVSTVTERGANNTIIRKTSMSLTNRRIMGTWIEDGGKTGNISGVSPSAVDVTLGTVVTNTATL